MKSKSLRIKEALKEHRVTQVEIARHLKMQEVSLSIAIKNESLSVEKLQKIADYLGVPIQELFSNPHAESSFVCPHCGKRFKIVPVED